MTDEAQGSNPQAGAKKGMPVWGWVLIGCGGLIVVGFVMFAALGVFVFRKGTEMAKEATGIESLDELGRALEENPVKFAAETAIRLDPDLELVSSDDAAGTLTFENKKTGEVVTLDYEEIAEGRFSVKTEEGEYSVSASEDEGGIVFSGPDGETRMGGSASLDDVPEWVPAYPNAAETVGSYSSRSEESASGMVSVKTDDGPDAVVGWFETWFEDEGWEITSRSMSSAGGGSFGALVGKRADEGRTLNVGIVADGGQTQVTISYVQILHQ